MGRMPIDGLPILPLEGFGLLLLLRDRLDDDSKLLPELRLPLPALLPLPELFKPPEELR